MRIDHLYGRSVADTAAMVALTRRTPWAVRTLCERDEEGYDIDTCTATLQANPHHGRLMTAADAQKYLGVPANRVYQWAYRSELRAVDTHDGRPVYLVEDLLRLIARADTPRQT